MKWTRIKILLGITFVVHVHCGGEKYQGDPIDSDFFHTGKADFGDGSECEQKEVLAYLNQPALTLEDLPDQSYLARSMRNLIAYRYGPDGIGNTEDDDYFDGYSNGVEYSSPLEELDAVPWIGPKSWAALVATVADRCREIHFDTENVTVVFNQPDCDDGCRDPAGEVRTTLLKAVNSAHISIDMAIYGFKDDALVEAICAAIGRGVEVRVVAENSSQDPEYGSSYYTWLFAPDTGLLGCGAMVEPVESSGLMHHKFILVDAGTENALLVTGSVNFTTDGFEKNHNHITLLKGVPELFEAFLAEFDQLFGHCRIDRLDGDSERCQECTPACTEDTASAGPWKMADGQVWAYFAPSDDALIAIRGEVATAYLDRPDPACYEEDADCICRRSGSRWKCEYCNLIESDTGWGMIGRAEERIAMTMFSFTDQCLALGWAQAVKRGVSSVGVWDYMKSSSPYARDDYLCAQGVPTYVCRWGNGSSRVLNHNKILVIDDMVVDGSLNLSATGVGKNNENTLIIESRDVADIFVDYIGSEVALLERMGVEPLKFENCLCNDMVDNDADGLADADDPDCDAGTD